MVTSPSYTPYTLCPSITLMYQLIKTIHLALAGVAHLVGASSHKLKRHRFSSWSGHIPRLQVRSLVGALTRGSWPILLNLPGVLGVGNIHNIPPCCFSVRVVFLKQPGLNLPRLRILFLLSCLPGKHNSLAYGRRGLESQILVGEALSLSTLSSVCCFRAAGVTWQLAR